MIHLFLKAKHWQLFLLIFAIPMVFQFGMMGSIFSEVFAETMANPEFEPDPTMIFSKMQYLPIIMLFYMVFHFGWFWSLAIGLQKYIPENVYMKTKQFKIFFFIPLIYISFLIFWMVGFFEDIFLSIGTGTEPDFAGIVSVVGIIIPLHLFSVFCMFYQLYFIAKTIKTVELQKETSFSDFAAEFFLLWFYFVGVWIVQPKVNKIVEEKQA